MNNAIAIAVQCIQLRFSPFKIYPIFCGHQRIGAPRYMARSRHRHLRAIDRLELVGSVNEMNLIEWLKWNEMNWIELNWIEWIDWMNAYPSLKKFCPCWLCKKKRKEKAKQRKERSIHSYYHQCLYLCCCVPSVAPQKTKISVKLARVQKLHKSKTSIQFSSAQIQ
jgi:hypothetical protein